MRRRYVIASIAVAVVLFVIVSVLLARAVGVGDAQTAAVTALVRYEAQGNTQGVISLIQGCARSAACRAHAESLTATLKAPGAVTIAQLTPSENFAVTSSTGIARVAWLVGSSLPRTQCVRLRNGGSVLTGFDIQLLDVTPKLASDASCPSRF
jgi:hypothetical protein